MKAKMTDKPAQADKYICGKCNIVFVYKTGTLTCPVCHNGAHLDMVLINGQDNPAEEAMYNKEDWHGG
jgi:uncharacterized Zn finger protein (UPF0148 family)